MKFSNTKIYKEQSMINHDHLEAAMAINFNVFCGRGLIGLETSSTGRGAHLLRGALGFS